MPEHACGDKRFSVVVHPLVWNSLLSTTTFTRNSCLTKYPGILLTLPSLSSKAMVEGITDVRFCDDDVLLNPHPSVVEASILPSESSLRHQGTCLLCYERFGLAVARASLTFYSFNSSALVTKTAFDSILKFFTSYHWNLYHFKTSGFF